MRCRQEVCPILLIALIGFCCFSFSGLTVNAQETFKEKGASLSGYRVRELQYDNVLELTEGQAKRLSEINQQLLQNEKEFKKLFREVPFFTKEMEPNEKSVYVKGLLERKEAFDGRCQKKIDNVLHPAQRKMMTMIRAIESFQSQGGDLFLQPKVLEVFGVEPNEASRIVEKAKGLNARFCKDLAKARFNYDLKMLATLPFGAKKNVEGWLKIPVTTLPSNPLLKEKFRGVKVEESFWNQSFDSQLWIKKQKWDPKSGWSIDGRLVRQSRLMTIDLAEAHALAFTQQQTKELRNLHSEMMPKVASLLKDIWAQNNGRQFQGVKSDHFKNEVTEQARKLINELERKVRECLGENQYRKRNAYRFQNRLNRGGMAEVLSLPEIHRVLYLGEKESNEVREKIKDLYKQREQKEKAIATKFQKESLLLMPAAARAKVKRLLESIPILE